MKTLPHLCDKYLKILEVQASKKSLCDTNRLFAVEEPYVYSDIGIGFLFVTSFNLQKGKDVVKRSAWLAR